LVSKAIIVIIVLVIAAASGVFAYLGLEFQRVREENLKLCDDAQKKVDQIAGDPSIPASEKDKQIYEVLDQVYDEMQKRESECLSFHLPAYNETKSQKKP
jgi:hypothetical protein